MMLCDKLLKIRFRLPSAILGLLLAIALVDVIHRPSVTSSFAAESKSLLPEAEAVAPTLITVSISPEARVKATANEGPRVLQQSEWTEFSHRLIMHGRKVCLSRKPRCETCAVADLCPKIGVKGLAAARRRKSSGRKVVKSKTETESASD